VRAAQPARAPLPSRKEQGEITRRAILDAAIALYAEAGVRGTGLMAIGKRAGVHHATVLYHFKSSRELLLAVLRERDRLFMKYSQDVLDRGGLEALRLLPFAGRFNVEHPVWAKLFAVLQAEALDPDAEAHSYFVERRDQARALVLELLRSAKKRGEIRKDVDFEATANVVLAFTAGINIGSFLDPQNTDVVVAYRRFTDMLIEDLTRGVRRR
jgi:AcrR family transcriptional regulator